MGHIARAALDGWPTSSDVVSAMESDANTKVKELRVDGGASANDHLMQFQSDILKTRVIRPTVLETTALGAAYLAGLAVGYWPDRKTIAQQWQIQQRFSPKMKGKDRTALLNGWQQALKQAQA